MRVLTQRRRKMWYQTSMKRKEQWNAEEKESVFALLSYLGCDEKQRWERKRIKMETVDSKRREEKAKSICVG